MPACRTCRPRRRARSAPRYGALASPPDGYTGETVGGHSRTAVHPAAAASQNRLLGRTLTEQVAQLLLDEAVDGQVPLPRRTLAAMLGVQRSP